MTSFSRFGPWSLSPPPGVTGRAARRQRALTLEPLEPRIVLASQPVITEFMASNSSDFRDGDGNASDWIEIYNPTAQAINLAGWHLTDDDENLDKWTFPAAPQAVLDPTANVWLSSRPASLPRTISTRSDTCTDFGERGRRVSGGFTDPSEAIISAFASTYHPTGQYFIRVRAEHADG
jgi:hypothetical protein